MPYGFALAPKLRRQMRSTDEVTTAMIKRKNLLENGYIRNIFLEHNYINQQNDRLIDIENILSVSKTQMST